MKRVRPRRRLQSSMHRPMQNNPKPGEVYLIPKPCYGGTGMLNANSFQAKCVLIVGVIDNANRGCSVCIWVPLTTKHLERANYSVTDVFIGPEESHSENGVRAMVDQFGTIPTASLIKYRYSVSKKTLREILKVLDSIMRTKEAA
jgi:mRNA-degrading endonuclease toxin of MazEF toxin-antitoxin module